MERDQNPTREKARTNQTLLTGAEEEKMAHKITEDCNGNHLTAGCEKCRRGPFCRSNDSNICCRCLAKKADTILLNAIEAEAGEF